MELFCRLRILIFIVIFCFGAVTIAAQETGISIEQIIEELSERNEGEFSSDQLEELWYFAEHPLNINTASKHDLEKLYFLTPYQIENLHYYIYRYGGMTTIYELLAVEGFDKQTLAWLVPFVRITDVNPEENAANKYRKTYLKSESILRTGRIVQQLKGSRESDFLGSPWQMLYKQRLETDMLTFGLTYEKDVGEAFWNEKNNMPEHLSFTSEYKTEGLLKQLVVGDYRANFGQGLMLWQNFGMGKSSMVMNSMKTGTGISKHTSATEFGYFRGVAASFGKDMFSGTVFVSSKRTDASTDTVFNRQVVTSLLETGYHRTSSELEKSNQLRESAIGLSMAYRFNRFNVSVNGFGMNYDIPLWQDALSSSQSFFYGLSADMLLVGKNYMAWCEGGSDINGCFAGLAGLNLYPKSSFSIALLARSFQNGFYARYSSPFSESGETNNESGLYLGFEFLPFKGAKIQSYLDIFKFPAPRYNVDMPSSGIEALCNIICNLNKTNTVTCKLKYEEKEKNYASMFGNEVYSYSKTSFKCLIKSELSTLLTLQSRIDYVRNTYAGEPENGWMISQDIFFDSPDKTLSVDTRLAFFSTDSYQTGIYAYEPDVLYAFSVPVHYGKGMRLVLNIKYAASDRANVYFKIGHTTYADRESVSSGLTEINGSKKTDVRIQFRYSF